MEFKVSFDGNTMKSSIKDEGIGIPKSEQHQLFDRLFRAKNVGILEGSGLGLSIVKKCLDLIGGEISFKSETNKGSLFELSIPVNPTTKK